MTYLEENGDPIEQGIKGYHVYLKNRNNEAGYHMEERDVGMLEDVILLLSKRELKEGWSVKIVLRNE